MPAPSTKQIYNFKGNLVAAVRTILVAAGWDEVRLERETAKLKQAIRQEISFDLGEAQNEAVLPDGSHVYDFYPGRLRIRITSARRPDQASALAGVRDLHDQFVCEALDALEERKAPFTTDNLPYYAVKTIRPLGTRSDLDLQFLEDFTDVEFFLEFGIRSTAWPA